MPKHSKMKKGVEPAADTNKTRKKGKHANSGGDASEYFGDPVFFWKEEKENGFLSQWYRSAFTDPGNGLTFNCAEQYMMYKKAVLFEDKKIANEIMMTSSPRKQKGLARKVRNFDEAKWCEHRGTIVQRGNWLKFTQCKNAASMEMDGVGKPVPLRDLLLATRGRELAEASPFDNVWGIGFKAQDAMQVPRARWAENLLGKALMHVRSELEKEQE